MACLQPPHPGHPEYLMAHHTIGRRAGAVDTHIADAEISGIHAAIQWTGTHWNLRDLSRNGTWLNDQQLVPAKNYPLKPADTIRFGRGDNPAWRVAGLDAPRNLLIDLQTGRALPLEQYHLLPEQQEPLASLHQNPVTGQWLYELVADADSTQVVSHGQDIRCGGHGWRLFMGDSQGATAELSLHRLSVADFSLRFSVSHHEEHVQLQLHREDIKLSLPARTHTYLLLYLARARMRDLRRGADPDALGWVSIQLATRELGINVNHLNTQIFRARKQIAESLPDAIDTSNLVERRSWEIRLGCAGFEIFKGTTLEFDSAEAAMRE
ncbi:FHA domain-containing protein [Microbulbifer sp. 2201CG32-9]|uniref:FHA domain-containing protein n=1 Tax=Microbulbifer sp. 2201CG32-9 TaxID=3232309 RepID=UPI00345C3131